jgi:hypothetical protein
MLMLPTTNNFFRTFFSHPPGQRPGRLSAGKEYRTGDFLGFGEL